MGPPTRFRPPASPRPPPTENLAAPRPLFVKKPKALHQGQKPRLPAQAIPTKSGARLSKPLHNPSTQPQHTTPAHNPSKFSALFAPFSRFPLPHFAPAIPTPSAVQIPNLPCSPNSMHVPPSPSCAEPANLKPSSPEPPNLAIQPSPSAIISVSKAAHAPMPPLVSMASAPSSAPPWNLLKTPHSSAPSPPPVPATPTSASTSPPWLERLAPVRVRSVSLLLSLPLTKRHSSLIIGTLKIGNSITE